MVEWLRLIFWILACFFMIPVVGLAWIELFWLDPDDREDWDDDITEEYDYEHR